MQATLAELAIVREAETDDLEAIESVFRAANAQFADVLPSAVYRAFLANLLDVRGRRAESQLLVAEREGRIVGTISLYPDASREGWGWPSSWTGIRALAVAPSARGLGIGRALTLECIERSRALGAPAVCLHTATFMEAAVAMYERLGFRRLPAFDLDVAAMFDAGPAGVPIVALAYWLDLVGTAAPLGRSS